MANNDYLLRLKGSTS